MSESTGDPLTMCENCRRLPVQIEGFVCHICMSDHNLRATRRDRSQPRRPKPAASMLLEPEWGPAPLPVSPPLTTPIPRQPDHRGLSEQQQFGLIRSLLGALGAENLRRVIKLAQAHLQVFRDR